MKSPIECASLGDGLVALAGLVRVLNDVLLLQLAHALNLIEVHNEALIVTMKRLDTLPAKDVEMVRTIEMHDALRMLIAQLLRKAVLVLILKVKAGTGENGVLLDNLIEDVYVEGQSFSTL